MGLLLQFLVFFIATLSTAAIYLTILPVRNKVSCNSIMVSAMAIGTMNGLFTGTILALTQSFSLNCILSMIVGVSTGLVLGSMFNFMTTIEGMLGGLMGGLMGPMLGEMLIEEYIYIISAILLVIMGLVTILLIKHIKQEVEYKPENNPVPIMNLNRLTLVVAFSSFLLFSSLIWGAGSPIESEVPEKNIHH